jgi:hypothetical protein
MSHVFDPKEPALQPIRSRRRTLAVVGLWFATVISVGCLIGSSILSYWEPIPGDLVRIASLVGLLLSGWGLRADSMRPTPLTEGARLLARGIQIGTFVLVLGLIATLGVVNISHPFSAWNLPGDVVLFVLIVAMTAVTYRANLWHWREEHRER